jgi:hypothetical protein
MKQVLAITALFLMISTAALADSSAISAGWTEATPEAMTEASLELLLKGDYVSMATKIFENGDPRFIDKDKVEMAKRQFVAHLPTHEKYLRYEFVEKKMYGESVVRLTYIAISESAPVTFTIHYHKPKEEWQLLHFSFSDKKEALP